MSINKQLTALRNIARVSSYMMFRIELISYTRVFGNFSFVCDAFATAIFKFRTLPPYSNPVKISDLNI